MTLDEAISLMSEYYRDGHLTWPQDKCKQFVNYWSGSSVSSLDGEFTADELEAIAVIMRSTIK
jgi:hypothetical protein